ncbi:uncharacterized protein LOC124273157 isoform X2 [Haliotis rubra]|uniref:uncharacterized protein LOC124273157 isoform X2 n=1 Tax=Haliotis rubra TaxID=36100 RepID=UPI001EE5881E|nr:uncharacterized protein LOC124273157 isoform X2 [Haliotis rubra]
MVPCFHKTSGKQGIAEAADKAGQILIPMKMWKLLNEIAIEKENDVALATNDFFRPDLKQIGNSIFEIKKYFIDEGVQTVAPSNLEDSLAEVKDCLLGLTQNHAFVLGLDPRTDKEVENKNYPKSEPCFMFLSETLSFALDFATSCRPNIVVCDVFIAFPSMPTMVLSVVDGDEDSEEALVYNTSVARGVRDKLLRFMDEDVNSIHGVINTSTLKDSVVFNTRLKTLTNDSFRFVPKYSLLMNTRRHDRILTAFWAGVAETKSVLKEESGDTDGDYLRFLTKEQCIILVENINSKDVEVKCMPGSGATTLMLEVARRLNRLGDTLLVCRSRQERDRLRSVCPSAVSVNDLSHLDLSPNMNIVDETNSVPPETRRHRWQFTRYVTDIKQFEDRKWVLEREIDSKEKLMDVFANDIWRRKMGYLLGDFDVLILLFEKIKPDVRHHPSSDNMLTYGGLFPAFTLGKHAVTKEAELIAWQERVAHEESVFPILRSVMVKDRTSLIYQDVKMAFLEKVSRREKKGQESSQISETNCWNQQNTASAFTDISSDAKDGQKQHNTHGFDELNTTDGEDEQNTDGSDGHSQKFCVPGEKSRKGSSSKEALTDNNTEDQLNIQDTDGEGSEGRMQDIEDLNEELDSLQSNRDHRRRQLHKLQTDCWTLDEWQNSVDYLMRYPEVLSLLNVELPGMDSVNSSHREDQDESNLPRGIKHRQSTFFTKDSKLKLSDVTSKLVEVETEDGYTGEDGCHSTFRYTGLIHQLRKYQHGSLKKGDLTALTLKVMAEDGQQLADLTTKNHTLEKGFGRPLHVLGMERRPSPISCPKLHLDAARANTDECHVTTDGQLVNSRSDTRDVGQNTLQKYWGTSNSPIPLIPSSSTLTPLPTTPRYWETETRVRVGGGLSLTILEMGLCEAGRVDSEILVSYQHRTWCVRVQRCNRHGGSICTRVWRKEERGKCHQNTMSHAPGTQATLHYGVVLDVGRGRVAFIDLDRQVVLDKYNVQFNEPLVPMFGVGSCMSGHTVSMSLISGEDINMTDTKKALIYQALK